MAVLLQSLANGQSQRGGADRQTERGNHRRLFRAVPERKTAAEIGIGTGTVGRRHARDAVLRQYRTILMVRLRRQIFRQSKQKSARIVDPIRRIFVTNDGKDASKRAIKASAANCAVLP